MPFIEGRRQVIASAAVVSMVPPTAAPEQPSQREEPEPEKEEWEKESESPRSMPPIRHEHTGCAGRLAGLCDALRDAGVVRKHADERRDDRHRQKHDPPAPSVLSFHSSSP